MIGTADKGADIYLILATKKLPVAPREKMLERY